MRFCIIGTGNIAWFFGKRLVDAGHHCVGVYGRNAAKAAELASALNTVAHYNLSTIKAVDVYILAISDASIPAIAAQLQSTGATLMHTAGAVPLSALGTGPDTAVLWPIYSISRTHLPNHRNIPCAWEASSLMADAHIQTIGKAITDELFHAAYEQRKWLHLSAVISNNFVNHLMAICEQICKHNQLPFAVLQPIINQTVERIQHVSPSAVQTGPAARGDQATIERQLQLLDTHPEWRNIYEAITKSIQNQG